MIEDEDDEEESIFANQAKRRGTVVATKNNPFGDNDRSKSVYRPSRSKSVYRPSQYQAPTRKSPSEAAYTILNSSNSVVLSAFKTAAKGGVFIRTHASKHADLTLYDAMDCPVAEMISVKRASRQLRIGKGDW